jgi:hypothetical protein
VQLGFAHATEVVLYAMCGIMAAAALVALLGLQRGLQQAASPDAATVEAGT